MKIGFGCKKKNTTETGRKRDRNIFPKKHSYVCVCVCVCVSVASKLTCVLKSLDFSVKRKCHLHFAWQCLPFRDNRVDFAAENSLCSIYTVEGSVFFTFSASHSLALFCQSKSSLCHTKSIKIHFHLSCSSDDAILYTCIERSRLSVDMYILV